MQLSVKTQDTFKRCYELSFKIYVG